MFCGIKKNIKLNKKINLNYYYFSFKKYEICIIFIKM